MGIAKGALDAMAAQKQARQNPIALELEAALLSTKAAYARDRAPSAEQRIDRLNRLHHALLDYKDRIITTADQDFEGRSTAETQLTEIIPVLEAINYSRKNLRSWMKQSRRRVPLSLFGASAKVHYQPLGVVGIVAPWNYPVLLSLSPLVSALAAGNRVMMKTSEYAPKTGEAIKEMISEAFSDDEVNVFTGGADVAAAFTSLCFDHLIFTGSTRTGRIVMEAASKNLTPLTLELGGKSPSIIHRSFPIAEAAKRIAFGKSLNAGQACVSPDYLLVPRDKVDDFAHEFEKAFTRHYPSLAGNSDYTSIISERERERLLAMVQDAVVKGAEIIEINPADETFERTRRLPMVILKSVTDEMRVMKEEIFGPLLPIVPYDDLDDAIAHVNARPRPLVLYYFDWDRRRGEKVLSETHSGGMCINEVMTTPIVDDMPFGGIGASGMGHYRGKEGFLNLSKTKSVIRKGRFNVSAFVAAPWGNRFYNAYLAFQFWRFRKTA